MTRTGVFTVLGRAKMIAVAIAVVLLGALLVSIPAPAHAASAATGTGGLFVSSQQRILDTRAGTSSIPKGKFTANTWYHIPVAGQGTLPSSGISAVQVTFTVANQTAAGTLDADSGGATSPNTTLPYATFDASATTTNTAVLPVGTSGSIQVRLTSTADLLVDVQGYYTSGTTAQGGYVPTQATQVYNSGSTTYSGGQTVTFQVGGVNPVPSSASTVMLDIIEAAQAGGAGNLTAYPAGSPPSTATSLNWPSSHNYEWTTAVALPASGQVTIAIGAGSPAVKLSVGVEGYFAANNSGTATGLFTPGHANVYDSRTPSAPIAANSARTVSIAGVKGFPPVGSGVTAAAIDLEVYPGAGSQGNIVVAADDANGGQSTQQFYSGSTTFAFDVVKLGADGGVTITNNSSVSINVVVNIEGWFDDLATGPTTTGLTGARPSATSLPFTIDDQVGAKVDVGTGNLEVTTGGLTLPGVNASISVNETYNSLGWNTGSTFDPSATNWTFGLDGAGNLTQNGTNIVYTAGDGATWQFTPSTSGGVTSYTAPQGLHDTLTVSSTEYQLTSLTSNQVTHFNLNGQVTSISDKNTTPNTVKVGYTNGLASSILSTAGTVQYAADGTTPNGGARYASIGYDVGSHTTTLSQTSGSSNRQVQWAKDASSNLTSFTDADGAVTTFAYTGSDLTSITNPTGEVTTISYSGTTHKVSEVDQTNTSGAGTSTTRFSYPSSTQTLVAGPDTDTSQAVSAVPHTTYTINGQNLVTTAVDAAGRSQSAGYTNSANTFAATSSTVGAGSSASTTTAAYGENAGQSLTSVQSATGASSSAHYGSTTAPYAPTTTTDGNGNQTTLGYDPSGNIASSGPTSTGVSATLTRNHQGQVTAATSPNNVASGSTPTNSTTYAYDGNGQLHTITPVTGTSLGVKTYTYDAFGRAASETDGRGNTTSYTYDNDDRSLTTSFSDGTHSVSATYDQAGNLLTENSATGMITNTYDQLGHLLSTTNTAGGGTENYTYDKAGSELTSTNPTGTFTNKYDASGVLLQTAYPSSSGTGYADYLTNSNGVRTDEWLQADSNWTAGSTAPASYGTHIATTYDKSKRITELKVTDGSMSSPTTEFDTQYCFSTSSTGTGSNCGTADTDEIQWSNNLLSGQTTHYVYSNDRLMSATQAGGATNNTYAYTYDADGNRTSAIVHGSNPSSQTLTYNAADQITNTGYAYDGDGNGTSSPTGTATYNGAEQMTSSTNLTNNAVTTYTYAGSSQNEVLTEATSGGTTYTSTYGQGGQLVAYQDNAGNSSTIFNDPVNGQASLLTSSGITSAFIDDGIDNPVGVVDTAGRGTDSTEAFDPYGLPNYTGGTDYAAVVIPYQFKNGIQDRASGLVKFGQRWYSPTTGGWTQRDTLDAPLDPANANRYAFAGDDPINGSDAAGSSTFGKILGRGQPRSGHCLSRFRCNWGGRPRRGASRNCQFRR
jgi:RHS repeat-associated protein